MTTGPSPTDDSEITWLLHRAAQRLRGATGGVAEEHGITMREYIVLSALAKTPGRTQNDLGRTLGLDESTLMSQLDQLERRDLVVRAHAPHDRRIRLPAITATGETLRAAVAESCDRVEANVLNDFTPGRGADLPPRPGHHHRRRHRPRLLPLTSLQPQPDLSAVSTLRWAAVRGSPARSAR